MNHETSYLRSFFRYASLNVMGMIALSCYILADTFFVSQGMGVNGLTALNLAIPVYNVIHGSGLMIGMGGGTKYSIQRSQGQTDAANRAFTGALGLAALFAVFFVLTGLLGAGFLATLLGADAQVHSMTKTYLQVILLFSPAFLLNNVLLCFIRNDGAPQLSMAAMITGSLSNVVLDWVFIFPCGLGIFGAAFATGLAPIISMAILSTHFLRKKNRFHPVRSRLARPLLSGILATGLPSLVTEVSSGVVIIVFNALMLRLSGNVGVAAYGVIANLSLVVIAIYTGIAQGIQPLVSRAFGAGNQLQARATLRYALITMAILSGILYGILFLGASPIAGIFNSEGNATLQQLASQGMRLYFLACPFAGFNIILSLYLTSMERPRPAQAIALLRGFVVILPLTVLLAGLAGILGVWCSFPGSELLVACVGLVLFRRSERKSVQNR